MDFWTLAGVSAHREHASTFCTSECQIGPILHVYLLQGWAAGHEEGVADEVHLQDMSLYFQRHCMQPFPGGVECLCTSWDVMGFEANLLLICIMTVNAYAL